MPPFDKNQNSPTNWKMTKKKPKASCRMNGSAENSVEGTKNSDEAGETWERTEQKRHHHEHEQHSHDSGDAVAVPV